MVVGKLVLPTKMRAVILTGGWFHSDCVERGGGVEGGHALYAISNQNV